MYTTPTVHTVDITELEYDHLQAQFGTTGSVGCVLESLLLPVPRDVFWFEEAADRKFIKRCERKRIIPAYFRPAFPLDNLCGVHPGAFTKGFPEVGDTTPTPLADRDLCDGLKWDCPSPPLVLVARLGPNAHLRFGFPAYAKGNEPGFKEATQILRRHFISAKAQKRLTPFDHGSVAAFRDDLFRPTRHMPPFGKAFCVHVKYAKAKPIGYIEPKEMREILLGYDASSAFGGWPLIAFQLAPVSVDS